MADLHDNMQQFLQQQMELYGDHPVLDRQPLPLAVESASPAAPVDWESADSLAELENRINTCLKCPLGHTRHKFVFGSGSPNARVVFVGEAPGADEDRIGAPFVGAAGELLTKMLAAIGLDRATVYICNILKCRPPQNRDPLPEEIALCKPYLLKQFELLRPHVIVCLGRVAAHALLQNNEPLTALRGRWLSLNGIDLMVTYHPAALLRDASLKRAAWEDLKRLDARLNGVTN